MLKTLATLTLWSAAVALVAVWWAPLAVPVFVWAMRDVRRLAAL